MITKHRITNSRDSNQHPSIGLCGKTSGTKSILPICTYLNALMLGKWVAPSHNKIWKWVLDPAGDTLYCQTLYMSNITREISQYNKSRRYILTGRSDRLRGPWRRTSKRTISSARQPSRNLGPDNLIFSHEGKFSQAMDGNIDDMTGKDIESTEQSFFSSVTGYWQWMQPRRRKPSNRREIDNKEEEMECMRETGLP